MLLQNPLFFRSPRIITLAKSAMYACTACMDGKKSESFQSTVTIIYHMRHFTTCTTRDIVYLITCPCNKQYVGRTIRTFSIRVNEHITSIKLGRTNHTVPRHFLQFHDENQWYQVPNHQQICPTLERGTTH